MKILIILGISVVVLPLYGAAHQQHITLLAIPLACGYLAAVTAVWKWKPKSNKTENALDLDKTK